MEEKRVKLLPGQLNIINSIMMEKEIVLRREQEITSFIALGLGIDFKTVSSIKIENDEIVFLCTTG